MNIVGFESTAIAIAIAGITPLALAQSDFPSKPIQLIIGQSAGGNTDSVARTLAHEARKFIGHEVIVVNRAGATGTLGLTSVAAAPADGYTLGFGTSPAVTNAPFLEEGPTDMIERTNALLWLGRPQQAFAVKGSDPYRTVREFIEQARRNPGKLSIGVGGEGSWPSLVMKAIVLQEKVDVTFVPYKGEAPAVTSLLGGHVTGVGSSAFSIERHVAAGAMRTLASLDEDRLQFDKNVPTLIEQGFQYKAPTFFYLFGPKGLQAPVSRRLIDAFGEASRTTGYLDGVAKNGIVLSNPIPSDALDRYLTEERAKTGALVKRLGIKKG